jgi:Ni2+-binding GTPase involved in maturation of urease and hydrogenase
MKQTAHSALRLTKCDQQVVVVEVSQGDYDPDNGGVALLWSDLHVNKAAMANQVTAGDIHTSTLGLKVRQ